MTEKWTPGQWEVDAPSIPKPRSVIQIHHKGFCIARMYGNGPIAQANARLIAAAPQTRQERDLLAHKLADTVEKINREIEILQDAQGEWVAVQDTYAPDWVQLYKNSVERLEELRDDLAETLRQVRGE